MNAFFRSKARYQRLRASKASAKESATAIAKSRPKSIAKSRLRVSKADGGEVVGKAWEKKTAKARKRAARRDDPVPENRPRASGWVCSIDPGFVPIAMVFMDGPTSIVMHCDTGYLPDLAAEALGLPPREDGARRRVEDAKEELGDAFWEGMALAVRAFFRRSLGWFRDCSTIYVEQQIGDDEQVLEGVLVGVLSSLYPRARAVRVSHASVLAHFRLSEAYHGKKKQAHDENKRQSIRFLLENVDRVAYYDAEVRSGVLRTSHTSDCVLNYLYEHHRADEDLVKGPFDTRDYVNRRKPYLTPKPGKAATARRATSNKRAVRDGG